MLLFFILMIYWAFWKLSISNRFECAKSQFWTQSLVRAITCLLLLGYLRWIAEIFIVIMSLQLKQSPSIPTLLGIAILENLFYFFRTLLELFSQFSFSYVSLEFIYMCMLFFLLRIQLHSCMRKEIQIWTARTDLSIGFCFGGWGSSKYGMRLVRAKQIRTACCWNWRKSVWMYTGGKLTKQAMPKHGFIRLLQQKKLSLHPSWPPLGNLIFRRRSVFF